MSKARRLSGLVDEFDAEKLAIRAVAQGGTGVATIAALLTALQTAGAFGKTNILGTVAQASGVPTGALIERNSNANGEYVKFADGTMICTLVYDASAMAVTSGIGSIFQAGSEITWTYPAAFIAIPALMSSVDRNDGTTILGMYNRVVLANNAQWRIWSATSQPSGQTKNVKLLAIGRWF